jgi:hypothetical protein
VTPPAALPILPASSASAPAPLAPPELRHKGKVTVASGRRQPGEAMEDERRQPQMASEQQPQTPLGRQPQMSRRRKAVLIDAERIVPDDAEAIALDNIEDMPGFGDSDEIPFGG